MASSAPESGAGVPEASSTTKPAIPMVSSYRGLVAPIKPEFIVPFVPPPLPVDGAGPADSGDPRDRKRGPEDDEGRSGGNKRGRGGKGQGFGARRERTIVKFEEVNLCSAVAFGRPCPRGEGCKFSHDVMEYLASKPEDLGDTCPAMEAFGRCPVGVKCRFARAHTNMENGEQTVVDGKEDQSKQILNANTTQLQKDVRKGVYPLKRAAEAAAAIQAEKSAKKKDGPAAPSGGAAAIAAAAAARAASVQEPAAEEQVDVREGRLRPQEKKRIDFRGKLYLAPLTTVGNMPFRRICKGFGADVTCSEMALALNLVQQDNKEFALIKRHKSEDLFGVQICGNNPDVMAKAAEMLSADTYGMSVDFIDINLGCPIDMVYEKGMGSALLDRTQRLSEIVRSVDYATPHPLTCKIRTGVFSNKPVAHTLVPLFESWNVQLLTLHGRSREQRYSKLADWDYIAKCNANRTPGSKMAFFGNGDVLSHEDYYADLEKSGADGVMLARGALIKPWLFTEIKERRVWDISSRERFDMMCDYARYGLESWGTDSMGINTTRRFLLECCSFFYRYIPAGLLEVLPQRMTERPPRFRGRDELETLMASNSVEDWIKLVNRIPLLGKAPEGFRFEPKHKSNAYAMTAEEVAALSARGVAPPADDDEAEG
ncbi:tRNA-dihydrouridine synthase 3-like protein [Hyaloraphidium curvatum]|nr:tRNA-dihydrouridine synthase 3-like protein [Hyaloraphidium curvatum]